MLILGLNMFHADASAAIVLDGEVKFAIAEERLNRHKHFGGFPALAVKGCLDAVGAKISDVEHVAVGQDSDANLAKKVQYALANPAKILNFIRLRQRKEAMRDVRSLLTKALDVDSTQLRFQEHHLEHHIAHIASAYYCSPWEKAAGFSYDGSGDFVSTMMARCEGNEIEILDRVFLPHSLGSVYTMICEFIGYSQYGDEGKVMGLAPYGKDTLSRRDQQDRSAEERRLPARPRLFQAARQQSGNAGVTRWNREAGAPLFRPDGETVWRAAPPAHRDYSARHGPGIRPAAALRRNLLPSAESASWPSPAGRSRHGRRMRAQQRGQRQSCSTVLRSAVLTFSPRQATKAWPSAPPCTLIIPCCKQPRRHELKHSYLGPEFSESRIQSALQNAGLQYQQAGTRCIARRSCRARSRPAT